MGGEYLIDQNSTRYAKIISYYISYLCRLKIIRIFHVHEVNIKKVCPNVNCFGAVTKFIEVYRVTDKNSLYKCKFSLSTSYEHDGFFFLHIFKFKTALFVQN